MKKKSNYNPYGLHEKQAVFVRLMLLSTLVASLVGSLLFFPISQMLAANGAPSFVKYIVHYLSEIISTGALFTVLSLGVVAVAHEDSSLRRKTLLWEIGCVVVISFALRIFVYWLAAYLDKVFMMDFYFNNETLSYLLDGGGLVMYAFSAFLNLGTVLAVLLLSSCLVRRAYRRTPQRGISTAVMKKIPVLVYLAVALLFAIIETILTISDLGISGSFDVLITLLLPYVEIALFSLFGFYLLSYIVESFEKDAAV